MTTAPLPPDDHADDDGDADRALIATLTRYQAQFDRRCLVVRYAAAKMALAEGLRYPASLGTGLVWVAWRNPAYRTRALYNGLGEWLDLAMAEPARYRTAVERGGVPLLPLPFPDAHVVGAVRLGLAWLLASGSLREVLARVRQDPAWPRPGLLPSAPSHAWHPECAPRWRPATPEALRRLYRSPGLFGTYAHRAGASVVTDLVGRGWPPRVEVTDAFPSYGSSGDGAAVAAVLAVPPRRGPAAPA